MVTWAVVAMAASLRARAARMVLLPLMVGERCRLSPSFLAPPRLPLLLVWSLSVVPFRLVVVDAFQGWLELELERPSKAQATSTRRQTPLSPSFLDTPLPSWPVLIVGVCARWVCVSKGDKPDDACLPDACLGTRDTKARLCLAPPQYTPPCHAMTCHAEEGAS